MKKTERHVIFSLTDLTFLTFCCTLQRFITREKKITAKQHNKKYKFSIVAVFSFGTKAYDEYNFRSANSQNNQSLKERAHQHRPVRSHI